MRQIIVAAAVLLAACASAVAQPNAPTAAAPAIAGIPTGAETSLNAADQPAGAYALDSRHVSVLWRVRHLGLALFTARFDTISGTLNWDGANVANSSVNITIAANSVNTGVLNAEGQRAFDNEIHTQVLGSAEHPNITFVSRSVEATGQTTGRITGDLTLNGVTRSVVVDAAFEGGRTHPFSRRPALGFSGRALINRADFGANFDNPVVNGTTSNEVEILIQAEFTKS